MAAQVEILANRSRTGKTTRLLGEYRTALTESLAQQQPGRTLWLTPTRLARRQVLSELLDDSLPVCFAPNVYTFDAFAETILQSTDQPIAPLTEIGRRILVRWIIDDLLSQQQLTHFAAIASTPGFLEIVLNFISELKRNETWPQHFSEACAATGQSRKDRELAEIYRRYQDRLNATGRYDAEGRFWAARAALQEGHRGRFSDLSLIVVDGFTDFTFTQYEILETLAESAERMLISLPGEAPLSRSDLFAKSETARQRLERMSERGIETSLDRTTRRTDTRRPAFDHLADCLFANPRETEPASSAEGIEVLAAIGQIGEVDALAERVKRLLLAGTPAEEIVVALRSLEDYTDLIDEKFTAAGIPFRNEAGRPLSREPVLKALFAVLRMELEDWPFDRLTAVLGSNFFRPDWPEANRAVRDVASTLRRFKLHSGRQTILRALGGAVERAEAAAREDGILSPEDRASARQTVSAWNLLQKLSAVTEPLRTRRTDFSNWANVLVAVSSELGIRPHAGGEAGDPEHKTTAQRDVRAWDVFTGILFDAARAGDQWDDEPPRLSLPEFATELADLVSSQTVSPADDPTGRVRVLEAAQVRNLDVPYLFLAGLTEESFPHNRGDDCLYSESERRHLNEQGLSLGHRSSQSQDEMLLFYGVVTRARKHLVLSYRSVSSSGQPMFPSPYLAAIRNLFTSEALPETAVGQLDPVPPVHHILTDADLRLIATDQVRDGQSSLFRTMIEADRTAQAAHNILAAVDMAVARFHTRGLTRYEGMLHQSELLRTLSDRFGSDHQFSATQLEAYSSCPFRFFLSDILKIGPLESPETTTDYRHRGILIHSVLSTLHGSSADPRESAAGLSADEITARFRELVDAQLERHTGHSELQKALRDIERTLLHEWAAEYGIQWSEYVSLIETVWDSAPQPACLETPFGDVPSAPEDADAGMAEPLTFGDGSRQTRVRGRIDRIDVGSAAKRVVFNVIDYKTGGPPRFRLKDVEAGTALQLALYTLAVQRMGLAGADAAPFQMAYWSLRESGFVPGLKSGRRGRNAPEIEPLEEETLEMLESLLNEVIPRLAEGIRNGIFGVDSRDKECTKRCPYATVCRVNQIVPLRDSLEKRVLLHDN